MGTRRGLKPVYGSCEVPLPLTFRLRGERKGSHVCAVRAVRKEPLERLNHLTRCFRVRLSCCLVAMQISVTIAPSPLGGVRWKEISPAQVSLAAGPAGAETKELTRLIQGFVGTELTHAYICQVRPHSRA